MVAGNVKTSRQISYMALFSSGSRTVRINILCNDKMCHDVARPVKSGCSCLQAEPDLLHKEITSCHPEMSNRGHLN